MAIEVTHWKDWRQVVNEVIGRLVELAGKRIVFLANDPSEENGFLLGFRNSDGQETKLRISGDALDALVSLKTDPVVGTPLRPFPGRKQKIEWEWRLVEPEPPK